MKKDKKKKNKEKRKKMQQNIAETTKEFPLKNENPPFDSRVATNSKLNLHLQ